MFNQNVVKIYEKIHMANEQKTQEHIKFKVKYLGIEFDQSFQKERLMFLIAQHIVNFIDLHIQQLRKQKVTQIKRRNEFNVNHLIIKNKPNQKQNEQSSQFSGNIILAVYFLHYACGYFNNNIFKTFQSIRQVQKNMEETQDDEMLQVFNKSQNINFIQYERKFKCICLQQKNRMGSLKQTQTLICEKCMNSYHPTCQYQKLVCNKCFLTNYLFPLDSRFVSMFGQKRKINTYFHSKFSTFSNTNQKKAQFFIIKFDIDDYQDLFNAPQRQIMIKIMNFNSLENYQKQSSQYQRWMALKYRINDYQMLLNLNKFQIYFNLAPLKRKDLMFQNPNTLIFKIQNRIPCQKNNILVIKCEPGFYQKNQYQIGIFRVSKQKKQPVKQIQYHNLSQSDELYYDKESIRQTKQKKNQNVLRLNQSQYQYLQKYYKTKISVKKSQGQIFAPPRINNIKLEKENIEEEQKINHKKQLVRSFGCRHQQGFNLAEIKKNHLKMVKVNIPKKNQKQTQIQKVIEEEIVKKYQNHFNQSSNIKAQEDQLPFEETNFHSIKKYCIQHDLLRYIEIPNKQNYDKSLFYMALKKYGIGNKNKHKSLYLKKNQQQKILQQQKKYSKFVKCQICQNHLFVLYLLPFCKKQGQSLRQSQNKKKPKKSASKSKNIDKIHVNQLLLSQVFKPDGKSKIFSCKVNISKKQQSSDFPQMQQDLIESQIYSQSNEIQIPQTKKLTIKNNCKVQQSQIKQNFNSGKNMFQSQNRKAILLSQQIIQRSYQAEDELQEQQQGQLSIQQIFFNQEDKDKIFQQKINKKILIKEQKQKQIVLQSQSDCIIMQQQSSYTNNQEVQKQIIQSYQREFWSKKQQHVQQQDQNTIMKSKQIKYNVNKLLIPRICQIQSDQEQEGQLKQYDKIIF